MKINNKLFLITATLGLMAAGSATAFANHANYVYVTNETSSQITATESWQSGGAHMHFYKSGNGHDSYSPLTINIPAGGKVTFREDENSGFSTNGPDTRYSSHTGIGLFTFVKSGVTMGEHVALSYHTFYHDNGAKDFNADCEWNHLNNAVLVDSNYQAHSIQLVNNSGTTLATPGPQELLAPDKTTMYINILSNASGSTSSPMGKLSSMLQNFRF